MQLDEFQTYEKISKREQRLKSKQVKKMSQERLEKMADNRKEADNERTYRCRV